MNPLKESVYRKLKGNGLQDLADKVNEISKQLTPDFEKQAIRPGIPSDIDLIPIGVSRWKNLGIKLGYWNHFKQEVKKDIIEELLK